MSLPERITTASVTGEGLEVDVRVYMGLEAVRTTATMIAFNPGALKNESCCRLPGRRKIISRNNVCDPSNIREFFKITSREGQLGDLVGDRAAKYVAPLEGGE